MMRAMKSVAPPGGKGTIIRIGLLGHACAKALAGNSVNAPNASARVFDRVLLMAASSSWLCWSIEACRRQAAGRSTDSASLTIAAARGSNADCNIGDAGIRVSGVPRRLTGLFSFALNRSATRATISAPKPMV